MPMPASSRPSIPAASSASFATARVTSQISAASCSTQPGRGKCWRELAVGAAGDLAALVEDEAGGARVPWSIARITAPDRILLGIFARARRETAQEDADLPDVEAHITGTVWKIECEVGQEVARATRS